jgi:hypothetical protein
MEQLSSRSVDDTEEFVQKIAMKIEDEFQEFEALLQSLGADRDEAGKKYLEARFRLINFFQRSNAPRAEDLADRTLDRVAHIVRQRQVEDISTFIWGVAKNILREFWKLSTPIGIDPIRENLLPSPLLMEPLYENKQKHDCLDRCINKLRDQDKRLFREYFIVAGEYESRTEQTLYRRRLADNRSLTIEALHVKAHRLRQEVRRCCLECATSARRNPCRQSDCHA